MSCVAQYYVSLQSYDDVDLHLILCKISYRQQVLKSRDQLLKLIGNCPPVSPNTVFCPKRDVSIDVGIKGGVGGQISRLLIRVYNINCNDIIYRFRMEIDVAYLKSQDWPSTSITAR